MKKRLHALIFAHVPQMRILMHAMGFDDAGNGKPYRNHYATNGGLDIDFLVRQGFMRKCGDINGATCDMYQVTKYGQMLVLFEIARVRSRKCCANCKHLSTHSVVQPGFMPNGIELRCGKGATTYRNADGRLEFSGPYKTITHAIDTWAPRKCWEGK